MNASFKTLIKLIVKIFYLAQRSSNSWLKLSIWRKVSSDIESYSSCVMVIGFAHKQKLFADVFTHPLLNIRNIVITAIFLAFF